MTTIEGLSADQMERFLEGKRYKEEGDKEFTKGTDVKEALRNYHKALLHWKGLTRDNPTAPAQQKQTRNELDEYIEKLYNNMAACHIKQGNWQRALETAEKAIALNGENYKALFRKAKALGSLGYFEKSEVILIDLLTKNPAEAPKIKSELEAQRKVEKERERKANMKLRGFLNSTKEIFDETTAPKQEPPSDETSSSAKIEEISS